MMKITVLGYINSVNFELLLSKRTTKRKNLERSMGKGDKMGCRKEQNVSQ